MGLPVTVYRSTDAGAPVSGIPQKASDWIEILKACLVNGYGSKAPLGWTIEFEDAVAKKVVFKNSLSDGGSGGAFQVELHDGTDTSTSSVRFTAANFITGLDSYIEKSGYRVITNNASSTYVGGWSLIGCGRAFYIRQERPSSTTTQAYYNSCTCLWIGDVISLIPNDTHTFTIVSNSVLGSGDSSSSGWNANGFAYNNYGVGCVLYDSDGNGGSAFYTNKPYAYSANWNSNYSDDPTLVGAPVAMVPVLLTINNPSSAVRPSCRAIVAGVFQSPYFGFYGSSIPINRTFSGISYDYVYGYHIGDCHVQTSGEWYD